ncbi:MAG: flagellar motor switch protein FliG [bacterium]|nr:flagellar motor switch protein FliG [bacterium]
MAAVGELTGPQKAAILLVSLGEDASADVFKHLRDEEIEQITLEIARLPRIDAEQRHRVMVEFHQMIQAQEFISQGGIEYAREVLERSLGSSKAAEIINRLISSLQVKPFDFIRKAEPRQLLNFIQNEHPQTIALVLSYLPPDKASEVLSQLPAELQTDVTQRIAFMDRTSPEVLKDVERVLEKKLSSFISEEYTAVGGIQTIVDMLNMADRGTEKTILESLGEQNPELVEEIKKRMFVFEDIVLLDDRSCQKVLREVEISDLALALKGVEEKIKDKIFNNMPKRAAAMLRDELEYLGPVRARDVEEAQQKIVNIIRQLEDSGDIIVSRGGKGEAIIE